MSNNFTIHFSRGYVENYGDPIIHKQIFLSAASLMTRICINSSVNKAELTHIRHLINELGPKKNSLTSPMSLYLISLISKYPHLSLEVFLKLKALLALMVIKAFLEISNNPMGLSSAEFFRQIMIENLNKNLKPQTIQKPQSKISEETPKNTQVFQDKTEKEDFFDQFFETSLCSSKLYEDVVAVKQQELPKNHARKSDNPKPLAKETFHIKEKEDVFISEDVCEFQNIEPKLKKDSCLASKIESFPLEDKECDTEKNPQEKLSKNIEQEKEKSIFNFPDYQDQDKLQKPLTTQEFKQKGKTPYPAYDKETLPEEVIIKYLEEKTVLQQKGDVKRSDHIKESQEDFKEEEVFKIPQNDRVIEIENLKDLDIVDCFKKVVDILKEKPTPHIFYEKSPQQFLILGKNNQIIREEVVIPFIINPSLREKKSPILSERTYEKDSFITYSYIQKESQVKSSEKKQTFQEKFKLSEASSNKEVILDPKNGEKTPKIQIQEKIEKQETLFSEIINIDSHIETQNQNIQGKLINCTLAAFALYSEEIRKSSIQRKKKKKKKNEKHRHLDEDEEYEK